MRKRKLFALLMAVIMTLSAVSSMPVYAAGTSDVPNKVYAGSARLTDISGHAFEREVLALYGYGALAGTVSDKGEFFPDMVCSEGTFARWLANMYQQRVKSPTLVNSNVGVSQKRATELMTYYSEKLGYTVTWNGGDPNATVSRAVAASFIVSMLNCQPELIRLIGSGTSTSNPPSSSGNPDFPVPSGTMFDDVDANAYYAAPVAWAVRQGITNGTGATTFSPDVTCTVAQVLTFLYRANGSPALKSTDKCPYVMDTSNFAYKAICWANGKGLIVSGDTLDPNTTACTRAYLVQCLWVLAGKPSSSTSITHFTDVKSTASYAKAVKWALGRAITTGTSATTFSPFNTITRGQAMTFLYRTYATS